MVQTTPHELFFDVNSGGAISRQDGYSIRFNYNGVLVGAKFADIGDWSVEADAMSVHHLAATWDNERITLYFDGRRVASGGNDGAGELSFAMGDLQFGEDYPPTPVENEPFRGTADDILILRQILTQEQVADLAAANIEQTNLPNYDNGILLNVDEPVAPLLDQLPSEGTQTVTGPLNDRLRDVESLINFATSAAGSVQCKIQDKDGNPIPDFTLADSDELSGDVLEHAMSWKGRQELKSLSGLPAVCHERCRSILPAIWALSSPQRNQVTVRSSRSVLPDSQLQQHRLYQRNNPGDNSRIIQ